MPRWASPSWSIGARHLSSAIVSAAPAALDPVARRGAARAVPSRRARKGSRSLELCTKCEVALEIDDVVSRRERRERAGDLHARAHHVGVDRERLDLLATPATGLARPSRALRIALARSSATFTWSDVSVTSPLVVGMSCVAMASAASAPRRCTSSSRPKSSPSGKGGGRWQERDGGRRRRRGGVVLGGVPGGRSRRVVVAVVGRVVSSWLRPGRRCPDGHRERDRQQPRDLAPPVGSRAAPGSSSHPLFHRPPCR